MKADSMSAVPPTAQHIEDLRQWRVRKSRTKSMDDLMPALARQWRQTERRAGAFADAWSTCVPPHIASNCRVEHMRGGVARVKAGSAATAFQLDRLLRSGLLATLRSACEVTLTKVEVRTGKIESRYGE